MRDVPRTLPYASGHGSLVTVPSGAVVDEQVPSRYMASKSFHDVQQSWIPLRRKMDLTALAVDRVEKLVPTTAPPHRQKTRIRSGIMERMAHLK